MKKLPIDVHSTGFAAAVAAVLMIGVYIFCTASSAKIGFYDTAMEKYDAGDYRGAVTDLRVDVGYNPEHSLGHYYLACSLLKIDQRSEARAEFDNAYQAELRSGHPDTVFAAKCLAKAKDLTVQPQEQPAGRGAIHRTLPRPTHPPQSRSDFHGE